MLSCHEASRLLSDRLDRPLRLRERLALRLHLAICRACTRTDRQLRFLSKAIATYARRDRRGGRKLTAREDLRRPR